MLLLFLLFTCLLCTILLSSQPEMYCVWHQPQHAHFLSSVSYYTPSLNHLYGLVSVPSLPWRWPLSQFHSTNAFTPHSLSTTTAGIVRVEQKNNTLLEMGFYDDGPYEVGDENRLDPALVPVAANSYLGRFLLLRRNGELLVSCLLLHKHPRRPHCAFHFLSESPWCLAAQVSCSWPVCVLPACIRFSLPPCLNKGKSLRWDHQELLGFVMSLGIQSFIICSSRLHHKVSVMDCRRLIHRNHEGIAAWLRGAGMHSIVP